LKEDVLKSLFEVTEFWRDWRWDFLEETQRIVDRKKPLKKGRTTSVGDETRSHSTEECCRNSPSRKNRGRSASKQEGYTQPKQEVEKVVSKRGMPIYLAIIGDGGGEKL